ncbi:class I SAM-dependent methyltransferase [Ferruginibacter sp.]
MKALAYIKYFFFLASKWNIKIAKYILSQEIKGEKKYGITTTGADELKTLEERGIDTDHSTIYMPVSYSVLEEMFEQLNFLTNTSFNHFLDIGCGKGRALCVAAHNEFRKVTGIDFSKEFCKAAEENLSITQQQFPNLQYKVINNDAFYFEIPNDVDCIFMFNPFDDVIMSGVAENILESFEISQRPITLIYVNPLYKEELLAVGFKQIYYTQKMQYLEAAILELK